MNRRIRQFLLCAACLFIMAASFKFACADIISSLDDKIGNKKSEIFSLEQQVKIYQQKIQQKRTEAETLLNKIDILETEISKLSTEVKITETHIEEKNLEILSLNEQITQKEADILQKKDIVANIVKNINEYDQLTTLEILLKYDNFADIFNQLQYAENLQDEVYRLLENLKELKNELEANKTETEQIKSDLLVKKKDLDEQKFALDKQTILKQSLLTQTKNEESQYKKLVSQLEKEKQSILGDIDKLMTERAAELARIQAIQKRPTSGLASTNWYFSQKDPAWADTTIGASSSLMKNYGCAISSVAMIFKYYGYNITPGRLAKEPIYLYNLIKWPGEWGDIKLVSGTAHNGVDWTIIDKEIASDHPVIVFVRANGKGAGHYVVIHSKDNEGKYVVHDPYWGPNIYLDSTIQNISVLYNSTTAIDQMIIYH